MALDKKRLEFYLKQIAPSDLYLDFIHVHMHYEGLGMGFIYFYKK